MSSDTARGFRTLARPMSENAPATPARKPDRRVARTRDRLGDALIEMLTTKPFDEVTVQDVLARAGVSRSTFYAHYRDKNDLFLSDVDDFFALVSTLLARRADPSGRVAAVEELFSHVAEARHIYTIMVESGRMHDVTESLGAFARSIEERLAHGRRGGAMLQGTARRARPRAGRCVVLASSLLDSPGRDRRAKKDGRAFPFSGPGGTAVNPRLYHPRNRPQNRCKAHRLRACGRSPAASANRARP